MKKLMIAFLVTFISLASNAVNVWAGDKIRISYFQSAPHIIYDETAKKVGGALFEMLEKHIAPEMKAEFVWDPIPANIPRQISNLENEKIDAAALIIYSPERAQKFSFTKTPYSVSKSVIGVLQTNPLEKVEKVEDILQLKIGYAKKTFVSPFMRDDRIHFIFQTDSNFNSMNLKLLLAGRIDGIYIPDKAALLYEIKNFKAEDKVRLIELPEPAGSQHVVFSKNNKQLADRFDSAYERINGNQKYRELLSKYLDVSGL